MDVIEKNVKKEDIRPEDFPFICRICLMPGDLRSFEDEDFLLDLFQNITKIDVRSGINCPKNICEGCVSKLEGISLFIDISKYNCTTPEQLVRKETAECDDTSATTKKTTEECERTRSPQVLKNCRFCSSAKGLTSLEKNDTLIQLFKNITSIDVKAGINSGGNGICSECSAKLQDMFTFISTSLVNDGKIESSTGGSNVKTESYPDLIENSVEIKEEHEVIDKKDIFVNDLVILATKTEQNSTKSNLCNVPGEHLSQMIPSEQLAFETKITKSVNPTIRSQTHAGEKPHKCDFCEKSFHRRKNLRWHILTHTRERPFECDLCDNGYSQKEALEKHMQTHTKKSFKCDFCNKRFRRETKLQTHSRIYRDKLFACEFCERRFCRKDDLDDHLRIHEPVKCDVCGEVFRSKPSLRDHLRTHAEENPFKCHSCEKTFRLEKNYLKHSSTHTEEIQCGFCGKRFHRKDILESHLRIHTGEKPFKCDLCEKRFGQIATLKQHLRFHSVEKTHKCDMCDKSFITNGKLQVHMRVHSGEKPYKCDSCERTFGEKRNMLRHLLTHTGEKQYKCDYCQRTFFHKDSLQKHLRSHTSQNTDILKK